MKDNKKLWAKKSVMTRMGIKSFVSKETLKRFVMHYWCLRKITCLNLPCVTDATPRSQEICWSPWSNTNQNFSAVAVVMEDHLPTLILKLRDTLLFLRWDCLKWLSCVFVIVREDMITITLVLMVVDLKEALKKSVVCLQVRDRKWKDANVSNNKLLIIEKWKWSKSVSA